MKNLPAFLGLLFLLVAPFVAGCSSTDDDDLSARPWNSPRNWEHGFPAGMMEGR